MLCQGILYLGRNFFKNENVGKMVKLSLKILENANQPFYLSKICFGNGPSNKIQKEVQNYP